ncbi:hypothetical protein KP78_16800 [Jeotgalibacillus soli]|uniref:Uncharacterized protein n=1 Tax=Jeotgalibacillus soli TaxID=889306 RepID=A0A0C2VW75_9BACL|nr:hypothetical protein KP78_16800 [Jeotgalibacillus soli]
MNRAIQIKNDIFQLQNQLDQLEKELKSLQHNCAHEFTRHIHSQECIKCQLVESLNW